MNVMVVDDEILEVQWIGQVLERYFKESFQNVFLCNSPNEALDIAKTIKIDILVVDMNMPEVNGIILSEEIINKLNNKCKILVISGYDDFYYAKRAIELRVHKYLLKPVSEEELVKNINELIDEVKKYEEDEKTKLLTEYIKTDFLNLIMKGAVFRFSLEDIYEYVKANNITWFYSDVGIILLVIDNLYSLLNKYPEYQRNYLLREYNVYLDSKLKLNKFDYTFSEENEICLIYQDINDELISKINKIIEESYDEKGLSITAIIGPKVNDGFNLINSYKKVKEFIDITLFYEKRSIIFSEQKNDIALKNIKKEVDAILQNINTYFCKGNIDVLIDSLMKFFRLLNDRQKIINLINYIIITINDKVLPYKKNVFEWDDDGVETIIKKKFTEEEMNKWLKDYLGRINRYMQESITDYNVTVIKEVEKYIERNIEKKIKLKDIAEQFKFSPNYLSMLFKEVKGENFIEYLHKKKLIYAKKLLNDPTLKVYEISDRLGYNNVAHFTKQFKDFFGYTPTEYRKIKE